MKNAMLALCLLAFTADASAWSREGHELVGELAQRRLSPAAQAEVARLLAAEPDPTLAGVAAWADEIRAESRSAGHPLGKRSEHWHYVNFPRGADCDLQAARDCPDGDCIAGALRAGRGLTLQRGGSTAASTSADSRNAACRMRRSASGR